MSHDYNVSKIYLHHLILPVHHAFHWDPEITNTCRPEGKLPIEVDLIGDSVQVSILCSKQETPPPPVPPKSFVTPRSSPRKARTERRLLSASKNSLFSAAATTNELAPPPVPLRTYASDIALAPPLPPKPKNL